jgi:hypothetical protein
MPVTPIAPKGATLPEEGLFTSFKDTQGRYRTQSLFFETKNDGYPAYFTKKSYNITRGGVEYPSLYLKYMEIADPTEYQVAIRLFGSWEHWTAMLKSKWFIELITPWRAELQTMMESSRYHEMKGHIANDPGSPSAIQASKWLADRYGSKTLAKRGRPSKVEKENHLKRLATEEAELEDDAKRIGLSPLQ